MQRGLVCHRTGQDRVTVAERHRQTFEPAGPLGPKVTLDPDLINRRSVPGGLRVEFAGHCCGPPLPGSPSPSGAHLKLLRERDGCHTSKELFGELFASTVHSSGRARRRPEDAPYHLAVSTPILATKLFIPQPRPRAVLRARLSERLNEGLERKLTLVSAPAGFGKTRQREAVSGGQPEGQLGFEGPLQVDVQFDLGQAVDQPPDSVHVAQYLRGRRPPFVAARNMRRRRWLRLPEPPAHCGSVYRLEPEIEPA